MSKEFHGERGGVSLVFEPLMQAICETVAGPPQRVGQFVNLTRANRRTSAPAFIVWDVSTIQGYENRKN